MFKTFIFKQHDDILKDRSIQKIHVLTKVPQSRMTLAQLLIVKEKCLIKEPK